MQGDCIPAKQEMITGNRRGKSNRICACAYTREGGGLPAQYQGYGASGQETEGRQRESGNHRQARLNFKILLF